MAICLPRGLWAFPDAGSPSVHIYDQPRQAQVHGWLRPKSVNFVDEGENHQVRSAFGVVASIDLARL